MPAEAQPNKAATPAAPPGAAPARPAWWVWAFARVPLGALYAITGFLGWLAWRVVPYRKEMIEASLAKAFPDFSREQLRAVRGRYCLGFAQMLAELLKASALGPDEIRRRVRIVNLEEPRALLARGQSVLLV